MGGRFHSEARKIEREVRPDGGAGPNEADDDARWVGRRREHPFVTPPRLADGLGGEGPPSRPGGARRHLDSPQPRRRGRRRGHWVPRTREVVAGFGARRESRSIAARNWKPSGPTPSRAGPRPPIIPVLDRVSLSNREICPTRRGEQIAGSPTAKGWESGIFRLGDPRSGDPLSSISRIESDTLLDQRTGRPGPCPPPTPGADVAESRFQKPEDFR